ncbi:MAG TPA: ATP-binding protein [Rhizomicrobium sp.]|nr:ATP-binding protein [Rhizomicrobium sp.]
MSLGKYSIGIKIFGAFIAMSALIALLGAAGYAVLASAGKMAVTTFDGPLMAINYARAAQSDFILMQMAELRYEHTAPGRQDSIAAEISGLAATFSDDLSVAEQRSLNDDEKHLIREIRPLVTHWRDQRGKADIAQLEKIAQQIDDKFDLLVELNTDHSFVERRQTATNIQSYEYLTAGATLLALLLAGMVTAFLRARIVRPLSDAAAVADRIADGELQSVIPAGGNDETGALLRSLTVMQTSIRQMMTRETTLRRSAENRLSDALETSREGVILVDSGGAIALANRQLQQFFPAIADCLVRGTPFSDALRLIGSQIRDPRSVYVSHQVELELISGGWVRMTATPTSEGGSILFFSDFTAIKEREDVLRKAKQEAEAAYAAKTRFLANMGHELRTPLNAIIGFSEIIHGELFGAVGNARYLDYSADILRSGRRLLGVINSVLDLSKSESGKMVLDVQDVDMSDVIQDCATLAKEQAMEAGLDFTVHEMDAALKLMGDPTKLQQVFLCLLSNAIKFTPRGGHVWVEAKRGLEGIAVTVGDNGIGMSVEDLAIALEPFGQVDNRLERRYEGVGLGLSLAKAFIELHQGRLEFESERGHGTRVTVTFPARAETLIFARAV